MPWLEVTKPQMYGTKRKRMILGSTILNALYDQLRQKYFIKNIWWLNASTVPHVCTKYMDNQIRLTPGCSPWPESSPCWGGRAPPSCCSPWACRAAPARDALAPAHTQIYRDYPRPPSLWCCARNILTVHRETLTQYITFKRGWRGQSVLLYPVALQFAAVTSCINASVRIVTNTRRWDLYTNPLHLFVYTSQHLR